MVLSYSTLINFILILTLVQGSILLNKQYCLKGFLGVSSVLHMCLIVLSCLTLAHCTNSVLNTNFDTSLNSPVTFSFNDYMANILFLHDLITVMFFYIFIYVSSSVLVFIF